ncbi:MAG TPA: hypothetical protein VGM78_13540, partial [Ilumatobacteraceae bacterium]
IKGLNGLKIDTSILGNFTLGTTSPLSSQLTRVFNNSVQLQVVKDGNLVPEGDGKFIAIAPVSGS